MNHSETRLNHPGFAPVGFGWRKLSWWMKGYRPLAFTWSSLGIAEGDSAASIVATRVRRYVAERPRAVVGLLGCLTGSSLVVYDLTGSVNFDSATETEHFCFDGHKSEPIDIVVTEF